MIFKKIDIKRYELNLKNKLINSHAKYVNRVGFIIVLGIDEYIGYGEASPLPLFSKENHKEVSWKFEEIKASLSIGENYDKEDLLNLFNLIAKEVPSLNFALDIALYDILSQKEKIFLSKYLNNNANDVVHFSSIYFSKIDIPSNTVKVKLGIKNINEDIDYFKNIAEQLNKSTIFRLDLNQSYDVGQVIHLYNNLRSYNIEYIEEPIKDLSVKSLNEIKKHTSFSIALDETIINGKYDQLISENCVDYAILKAPLFGSIKNIFMFKSYLDKNSVKLVLSSCLQTPIGNMSNIHIASALELDGMHGLNNHVFLNYNSKVPYLPNSDSINLCNLIGLGVSCDN